MMNINPEYYTDLELALMAIMGYIGNGEFRKNLLGTRYEQVQAMVNEILIRNSMPVPQKRITETVVYNNLKRLLTITEADLQALTEEVTEYE